MSPLLQAAMTLCCLTLTLGSYHQCRLTDIPIQPNFDQSRFLGVWYQVEWYPDAEFTGRPLQDFSLTISKISEVSPTRSRIAVNNRIAGNPECNTERIRIRDELQPGYFIDTNEKGEQSPRAIAYTDYDRFAVEFVCEEVVGSFCRQPEVYFWTRSKTVRQSDIAIGRRLIPQLCVPPNRRFSTVQNEVSTCNRRVNRNCRWDNVPVADPYSSARGGGVWYVIRSYPSGGAEPFQVNDDFNYEADGPSLRVGINLRNRETGKCIETVEISLREPTSGVFDYFDPTVNRTISLKISYASQNRQYGILSSCYNFRGPICTDPGVRFLSRGKSTLTPNELAELEALLKDLCVDPTVYRDPIHSQDCPAKVLDGNYQDVILAQIETLKASRDKFQAETEALQVEKEKLELQIQYLKALYRY